MFLLYFLSGDVKIFPIELFCVVLSLLFFLCTVARQTILIGQTRRKNSILAESWRKVCTYNQQANELATLTANVAKNEKNLLFGFMATFIALMNTFWLVSFFQNATCYLNNQLLQQSTVKATDNKAGNVFWHIIASFPLFSFRSTNKIIYS